ncbi:23S rRNA (guanosine(2251)-2'-O)-methyltransferase RlmB [Alkalilimnicola ehrlichii MLHE-1]|uniref:23S rRNA (guanosine-2'-O-)-methyltransferase RlmB n=1 Tax=Alkalilimnicola ehrlichii (strain ATCC BAA-1101 / DSM 17681 / MLHE-1) TaxID=187272 RepID=Q0AB52_ALKEH|nr:23S rRNA (guanosine(2251)-2'-O)-methyltransferase RlmB [Alkalilimnicola ehrlichii]ABI55935.1 23S rRNA Gm-2251 2'-O-methyltransferase [Alkalilimnicola ehrlichii MLHE-1]
MSEPELLYGLHAVRAAAACDADAIEAVWVEKGRRDAKLVRVLRSLEGRGLRIQRVSRKQLDELTEGGVHQGVAIRYRGPRPLDDNDLDACLDGLSGPAFLLVLDQVQDPHNLGACLRSAEAAGVHGVIAPRDRAAGLTPVVHKVSSGAAARVPYFQVTNLARTLAGLRDRGIWLVGAAGEAGAAHWEADLTGPLALCMGAEGRGLRRLTREACDLLVHIPMAGRVESLNVSVATGVVLWEALRQRR